MQAGLFGELFHGVGGRAAKWAHGGVVQINVLLCYRELVPMESMKGVKCSAGKRFLPICHMFETHFSEDTLTVLN